MATPRLTTAPARPSPIRCVIITIIALLLLLGLIFLIIYLVVHPAPIDYSIERAQVLNYNLTSSNNYLNATFDLSIQTNNHNKKVSIYYDSMEVIVLYSGQTLAVADVAPFHQPKRNVTNIGVRTSATRLKLTGDVAKRLKRERTGGVAGLEVRILARVRFKFGGAKSRHYTMKVDCSPVVVHFPSGKFQRVECDVDI